HLTRGGRGLKLCGSATLIGPAGRPPHPRWAWIETTASRKEAPPSSVAHLTRGGRGLKRACGASRRGSRPVAHLTRGGRGLKRVDLDNLPQLVGVAHLTRGGRGLKRGRRAPT